MAIVNATPDSFYAASRTQSHRAIAERVEQVLKEGLVENSVRGLTKEDFLSLINI